MNLMGKMMRIWSVFCKNETRVKGKGKRGVREGGGNLEVFWRKCANGDMIEYK